MPPLAIPSIYDGHVECTRQPQRGTVGRCDAEDTALRGRRSTGAPVAHPKIVSERLGHANVGITLDIYSHVSPHMQSDAAEKIEAGMRAALAK